MGTTLNNIHLRASLDTIDQVQKLAVEVLRRYMLSSGFVEVEQPDAQTAIIVSSDGEIPWISVYLGKTLDCEQAAPVLSQAVPCPLLLVMVFDSDVITLTLYSGGQAVNVFSDWANYEERPKRRSGNASLWRAVLPEDVTPDMLAQAWKTNRAEYPFESEGILARVVDLLDLDPDRVHFDPRHQSFPADYRVNILFFRRE